MHRILFVDDDAMMRELVHRVLERQGYYVHAVPAAEVALVLLKENIHFDLLMTDVIMPGGMDGFELADLALRLRPGLQVMYLTGYVNLPRRRLGELRGKLLHKPVTPTDLVRQVRRLLAAAA
jgi:CheY-like chemotaxis protein